jgi:serine/threonine protein phosphatase PrpC
VLLLCSDGLWGGLSEEQIASLTLSPPGGLEVALKELGEKSLRATAPHADNTTAAALRWLGP